MKKIIIMFILFLNVFLCVGCKNVLNPLHKEFRNFERATAAKLEVGAMVQGTYTKIYDCSFEDDLIEFTYPHRKYNRVIYDVRNGIEYYEGYECNYSAKNNEILNGRLLLLEKNMSNFSYKEEIHLSSITAKFNIIKMTKDSLGLDALGSDLDEIRRTYTDCRITINIISGKVKEIKIYPNYKEYETTYITYKVLEYGNQISTDIVLKEYYDEFTNYDEFLTAVENSAALTISPEVSAKGRYISLSNKTHIVTTNDNDFQISFRVFEKDIYYGETYRSQSVNGKNYFKDIDFSVPGTYERLFVYEYDGEKLAEFVTIHIVEEKEIKATKLSDFMPNSQEQFFFDNYFALANKITLHLYDLDNISEKHTFNIKGLYSCYYANDSYLYVAGYEKVNNTGNEDDYISYITKINLNTFEIEKQFTIDRYISKMVVDKYDNIIFSKGTGEQVTFEMYNANKEKLEYIGNDDSKNYFKNTVLIYDEKNERISYISNKYYHSSKLFEYDSSIENYKYVSEINIGSCTKEGSALNYVKGNEAIFFNCYHNFNDKVSGCHGFIMYFDSAPAKTGTISDDVFMLGRKNEKKYIIGVMDTKTYTEAYVSISGINLYTDLISEIHYHNGNIYLYDRVDRNLWVAEYK